MANPYTTLPSHQFWRRSFKDIPAEEIDIVVDAPFRIDPSTRVATAGSCFAQHVARALRKNGLNFFVTEKPHPLVAQTAHAEAANYGMFSARFGNIYSARQLNQLFKRAYGDLTPVEDIWRRDDGAFLDPFRPQIQANGFTSEGEYYADRAWHMQCVRDMFEQLDVFVFTLGLTETWRRREDGVVFPLCPGVAGGVYDPQLHEFYNQPVEDVVADMSEFLGGLKKVNPAAKCILTVSPVPLMATYEPRHVLLSTVLSKSILRVAAQKLVDSYDDVHYFPSYELITGNFNRGGYYGEDLRDIHPDGVAHVMRLFVKHFAGFGEGTPPANISRAAPPMTTRDQESSRHARLSKRLTRVFCDEEALDDQVPVTR